MLCAVLCPYCGRCFKHKGYYIRHDRDSIISCITKINIAINDKIHLEQIREPDKKVAQAKAYKRWYERNKERVLEDKKEYYKENKEKFHEYYISKRKSKRST
jgi:hypothetical protein